MKFSVALEHCLTTGQYHIHEYMCIAIEENDLYYHVPAVMKVVHSIDANCYSLFAALNGVCPVNYAPRNHSDKLAYGTQLYCWLVFDLKRKGL